MTSNSSPAEELNLSTDRFEISEKPNNLKKILALVAIILLVLLGIVMLLYISFLEYFASESQPKPVKFKINENVPEFHVPKPKPKPLPKPIEPPPAPIVRIIEAVRPVVQKIIKTDPNIAIRQRQLRAQLGSPINPQLSTSKALGNPSLGLASNSLSEPDFSLVHKAKNNKSAVRMIKASKLPDLNYVIAKGTPIPCTMNTAIQSDQIGIITCTINEDIYSANGSTVLIDRGSFATGEYRVDSLNAGKSRIFAIWDRVRMPNGVVIDLDSNATDSLGRAGIGGYIDRHYFERFGTAILISIIDDAVFAASNSSNNNTITVKTNDSAESILKEFQKIKPTLYKPQGAAVNIMVSHDLNFASVYKLKYAD